MSLLIENMFDFTPYLTFNYFNGLMMENFQVLMRVRPLTYKQQDQIEHYQKACTQSKKSNPSKNKGMGLSPNVYSFYSKYHNCDVKEIIKVHQSTIYVADPQYKNTQKAMRQFPFTNVFDQNCSNQDLFKNSLISNLDILTKGYNCTIMAYGITGSGKTYTVFGQQAKYEDPGVCYLACYYLMQLKTKIQEKEGRMSLKFSFMQIYNQNVKDLLSLDSKVVNVVEDSKNGTSIMDLTQIRAQKLEDVLKLVSGAANKRVTSSTQANQTSSRSHAILRISIQIQTVGQDGNVRILSPKLFIIDLAGSEKLQATTSTSKKNSEGTNINKSLLALGNCINALADNAKRNKTDSQKYIPYRDSKLTRILKDSLGGNSKTVMIACISPNPFTVDQTLTTLSYATRAQGIRKIIYKNQTSYQHSNQNQSMPSQYVCKECRTLKKREQVYNQAQEQENKQQQLDAVNSSLADIFNQIYQDVVENIRQSQKIKHLSSNTLIAQQQIEKLKLTNQQQARILKDTLFSILLNQKRKQRQIRENNQMSTSEVKNNQAKTNESSQTSLKNITNQVSQSKCLKQLDQKVLNSIKSRSRSRSKIQMIKRNKSKQVIHRQPQNLFTQQK